MQALFYKVFKNKIEITGKLLKYKDKFPGSEIIKKFCSRLLIFCFVDLRLAQKSGIVPDQ